MHAIEHRPTRRSPAVIGGALVVVGLGALALRQAGMDPFQLVGENGWPLFVIVPGLILLAAALLPAPPAGLGFAIAGSIVSTVGLILLYQQSTGHWESWAYAWALLPGASGLGLVGYGLLSSETSLVHRGLRLMAVALVLFLAGAWYFESVFAQGRVPIDLGQWWPVVLVGLGLLTILRARRTEARHDATTIER